MQTFTELEALHNTKVYVYPTGTVTTVCSQAIFRDPNFEARERSNPKNNLVAGVYLGADIETEVRLVDDVADLESIQSAADTDMEGESEEHTTAGDLEMRNRENEYIRRHRERIRDIVLLNDFTHFVTLTLNPDQVDSFDPAAVKKKLLHWLKNQVDRKGLKYVLIPEYHKSGRIHCHALVNDVFKLVDSGHKTLSGKVIYNMPEWRYGFTTAIPLDDNKFRISSYVCKYITKGSDKIFGKYFWSSKNVVRKPETIYTDTDFDSYEAQAYQPMEWNDKLVFKYNSFFELRDLAREDCADFDEAVELATERIACNG